MYKSIRKEKKSRFLLRYSFDRGKYKMFSLTAMSAVTKIIDTLVTLLSVLPVGEFRFACATCKKIFLSLSSVNELISAAENANTHFVYRCTRLILHAFLLLENRNCK